MRDLIRQVRPLFYVLIVSLWSACSTTPPAPVPPGPVPASIYEQACANLASLGCSAGKVADCAAVMQADEEAHLTELNPTCLAVAKTQDEARACKSVRCSP
jgi:hypothetical protein